MFLSKTGKNKTWSLEKHEQDALKEYLTQRERERERGNHTKAEQEIK